jgi:hypothetical protein
MEYTARLPGLGYAAIIGDLVGSKVSNDRRALQAHLRQALDNVNARIQALQPLTVTLGDEFQALYVTFAAAIQATLLLRLYLAPDTDVRFGIGWGPLSIYEPADTPYGQDGPAWWAARRAIETVSDASHRRESPRGWRTYFNSWSDDSTPPPQRDTSTQLSLPGMEPGLPKPILLFTTLDDLVNAYLVCRDDLVGSMDNNDRRITLALLSGRRQVDIAVDEKVSPSAIAQRLAKSGAYALLRSSEFTGRLAPWRP